MEFIDKEIEIIREKFYKLDECLNTLSLRLRSCVNAVITCEHAPFKYEILVCKNRVSYYAGKGGAPESKESIGSYGRYVILLNANRIKEEVEAKISKGEAGLGKIMNLEI